MHSSILKYAIVSALLVPALFSCRTSEENYRAAYEKTVEGRRRQASLDSTVYGANRRRMSDAVVRSEGHDVAVRRQRVRLTDGCGAQADALRPFNVVVGQFKQLFNAKSLQQRLIDAGYTSAFVVETAEPYYFIIAGSFDSAAEATAAMEAFKAKAPIAMKDPLPFVLEAVGRRRSSAPTK